VSYALTGVCNQQQHEFVANVSQDTDSRQQLDTPATEKGNSCLLPVRMVLDHRLTAAGVNN